MQPALEASSLHIQQTPPKLAKWLEYLLANSCVLVENILIIIFAVRLKAKQWQLEGRYKLSYPPCPTEIPALMALHFWVCGQWDTPPCQVDTPVTAEAVSQPVSQGASPCVCSVLAARTQKSAELCLTCPAFPENSLPCLSVVPTEIKALPPAAVADKGSSNLP